MWEVARRVLVTATARSRHAAGRVERIHESRDPELEVPLHGALGLKLLVSEVVELLGVAERCVGSGEYAPLFRERPGAADQEATL